MLEDWPVFIIILVCFIAKWKNMMMHWMNLCPVQSTLVNQRRLQQKPLVKCDELTWEQQRGHWKSQVKTGTFLRTPHSLEIIQHKIGTVLRFLIRFIESVFKFKIYSARLFTSDILPWSPQFIIRVFLFSWGNYHFPRVIVLVKNVHFQYFKFKNDR